MGCLKLHIIEENLDQNYTTSCPLKHNFQSPKNNVSNCKPLTKICSWSYRFSFNGQESDNEIKGNGNSLDFGARIYDPRLGRFLGIDPLNKKYQDLNPYNFVGNSPILLIDVDGREIILSFKKGYVGRGRKAKVVSSSEVFTKIVNNALEGQFRAGYTKLDNGQYKFTLVPLKGGGDVSKMTENGKAFYEHLSKVINDEAKVQLTIVYSDKTVYTGDYKNSRIDIADVDQFNETGPQYEKSVGATKAGKLAHEIVEQHWKQKHGIPKGSLTGFSTAHGKGIKAENDVNGNRRGPERMASGGWLRFPYTEKDGTVTDVFVYRKSPTMQVKQPKPVKKKN